MGKSIAVCNQKGGVGKSTTAVNTAAYLAISGKRALLIDLDPQGNATTSLGISRTDPAKTSYVFFTEGLPANELLIRSAIENLDLVPSAYDLAWVDVRLAQTPERETILRRSLESLRSHYDVMLFDCPPSLGFLTINALVASDCALIPVECEYLALEGLNALIGTIDHVKKNFNPTLQIGGILLTMVDMRANLTKEVAEEVKGFFKELVFETTIPRNVRLAEAPSFGKPICFYDPNSTGALAYQLLAREISEKILDKEQVASAVLG